MKVIIAGSRTILDIRHVYKAVELYGLEGKISEVVCGEAEGVDKLGKCWASRKGIKCKSMPADWQTHGKAAGYMRNEDMARYVGTDGALIAIWDGKSRGTKHMIDIAERENIQMFIYCPNGIRA